MARLINQDGVITIGTISGSCFVVAERRGDDHYYLVDVEFAQVSRTEFTDLNILIKHFEEDKHYLVSRKRF